MNLEIVIPVYEALDYLQPMLGMIDHHYPGRKLVLVDDCSGPQTRQFLEDYSKQPNTVFIQRQRRGWFTRCVNTGLRHVLLKPDDQRPEWVLTLNSDCTINTGAFEELLDVWELEEGAGKKIGMVGSEGPNLNCPRYVSMHEPDYVTGHSLLFRTKMLRDQNLLFPYRNGEVQGFSAQSLVHISSDRALSWEMNRRGFETILCYHANIGHHGGRSWNHDLYSIPQVAAVGEE